MESLEKSEWRNWRKKGRRNWRKKRNKNDFLIVFSSLKNKKLKKMNKGFNLACLSILG
jgi:hypothetical protein